DWSSVVCSSDLDGIGAAPRRLWSTAWHVAVSYGILLTAAYGGVPPRIDEGAISMTAPTPARDDKYSFGLWTTGWQAQDQFGAATRPALDMTAHIRRLAERSEERRVGKEGGSLRGRAHRKREDRAE